MPSTVRITVGTSYSRAMIAACCPSEPSSSTSAPSTGKSGVQRGAAFLEIVRYAKEAAIDLICIATHGRTGLSHALFGSVAEKVVRKAPCAVLSVRPEGHEFQMP